MALAVAGALVLVTLGVLVVAVARERGPGPDETAIAFQLARDRCDFRTLFDLSGAELRDGRDRAAFVAEASARAGSAAGPGGDRPGGALTVRLESMDVVADIAYVITRLERPDGVEREGLVVERRSGRWLVTRQGSPPVGDDPPAASPGP